MTNRAGSLVLSFFAFVAFFSQSCTVNFGIDEESLANQSAFQDGDGGGSSGPSGSNGGSGSSNNNNNQQNSNNNPGNSDVLPPGMLNAAFPSNRPAIPVGYGFNTMETGKRAIAADYYVHRGTGDDNNDGSESAPFETIQKALDTVQPGDKVLVKEGIYRQPLVTKTDGQPGARIEFYAEEIGRVQVSAHTEKTSSGFNHFKILSVNHAYYTFDGFIFDGDTITNPIGWMHTDMIKITDGGDHFIFRKFELRNGRRDAVDMDRPENVLFENGYAHDFLFWKNSRIDAHIFVGQPRGLTMRNVEGYYFSGDFVQPQYGNWDNVVMENCAVWSAQLETARAGFPANVDPSENAVDTKSKNNELRGKITIRYNFMAGFRSSYIGNAAALNLKHNVDGEVYGNILTDNEIAWRLRAPAHLDLYNNVIYNNARAIRIEDNIANLHIWNNTLGLDNAQVIQTAGGGEGSGFQMYNNAFLGSSKPSLASHSSNIAVSESDFADAQDNNYRLSNNSSAIDVGTHISGITVDFDKNPRPLGGGFDAGAFELK